MKGLFLKMEISKPKSIDEYILQSPQQVQNILWEILRIIHEVAPPEIEESISYGVPAFKLNGKPLIYFGGYKNHVSIYLVPRNSDEFSAELASYKGGKGTLQFRIDQALPADLIRRIVLYNANKILNQTKTKAKK